MSAIDVKREFPGALHIEATADIRRSWCSGYLTAMWGDHEGHACYCVGDPHIDKGKYRHRNFTQRFALWPAAREWLPARLVELAGGGWDVWVAPMLRATAARTKCTGAGGQWCWADLDGEMTVERRAAIAALGDRARLISSGTGHHLYARLDGWQPLDAVVEANRKLAAMLDADSKWSDDSLLRPPGTFNMKPVVFHGHAAAIVQTVTL